MDNNLQKIRSVNSPYQEPSGVLLLAVVDGARRPTRWQGVLGVRKREKARGAKGGGDAELDLKIHCMTTMV